MPVIPSSPVRPRRPAPVRLLAVVGTLMLSMVLSVAGPLPSQALAFTPSGGLPDTSPGRPLVAPSSTSSDARPDPSPGIGVITLQQLPPEAVDTLRLIMAGGPFPHAQDGRTFGNFERQLPRQKRGYYTEYTVRTPGARNRGARRIIAGGDPMGQGEFYYTDDHYATFRRILREPAR